MKLRLIINRFEETNGIEIPVNVTTTFDATGVDQLRNKLSKIETSFKKDISRPTGRVGTYAKDYFNSSALEKYKSTISKLKDSVETYKPTVRLDEQFSRNTPSILEMDRNYNKLIDDFKNSEPALRSIEDNLKNAFTFNSTARKELKDSVQDAYALFKHYGPRMTVGEQFANNQKFTALSNTDMFGTVLHHFQDVDKEMPKVVSDFLTLTPALETIDDKMKSTFKDGAISISELRNEIPDAYARFKALNDVMEKTESASKKASNGFKKLSSVLRASTLIQIQALAHVLRRAFGFLEESFTAAGDYVESMNLYTMSVGEYAEMGKRWAENISDALYLDTSEIYQYTGQFFNLTRGLGASAKAADLMSRNLTQLSYDMASYLNIDVSVANNKLMSAMSGQTKAVTSVGIAVQTASLQELAYSLNIHKSVEEMTQAEKTYLRYIQIMRSTTQMQGDLGRTIITPTNAMRLLRTQMNLLSRAIGQVFTPIIMKAIPIVIAFTQVLTELAQWLAKLLGYKLDDYLAPADNVHALADGFEDLADSANEAADSINRTLAPFDELNVVATESKGKGAGGLGGDSVLSDLEQYLDGYDMLEFYSGKMKKTIDDIKDKIKEFGPLIATAFAVGAITKFIDKLSKLSDIAKGVGLVIGGIGLIWAGQTTIEDNFWLGLGEKLGGTLMLAGGTFKLTKSLFLTLAVTGVALLLQSKWDEKSNPVLSTIEGVLGDVAVFGATWVLTKNIKLAMAVTSIEMIARASAMENSWHKFLTSIGGAVMGGLTTFMYTGNVVVSIGVAAIEMTKAYEDEIGEFFGNMLGYHKEEIITFKVSEDAQEAIDYLDNLTNKYKELEDEMLKNVSLVDAHKVLYDELMSITDANGKVQAGYESRAQFILAELNNAYGTEYHMIDGIISQYDKLQNEMELLIAKKKLEILLEARQEQYKIALQEQTEATEQYNKAVKEANDAYEEYAAALDDWRVVINRINDLQKKGTALTKAEKDELWELVKKEDDLHDKMKQKEWDYDNVNTKVTKYKDAMDKNTHAIVDYEDLLVASTSDNLNEINAAIDKSIGLTDKSLADQLTYAAANRESLVRAFEDSNGKITESDKKRANIMLDTTIKSLVDQTSTVKTMTPELSEAWKTLGELDKDKFNNALNSLPDDVKKRFNIIKSDMDGSIKNDMAETGKKIGKTIGDNVSDNMKVNGGTFSSTLASAIESVRLPRWLKNTPMGKMAENLGFQFYANGGFPDTGEMFVAREAGPELVGRIGSKTAVANNDQITTAMTNAMISAISGTNMNDKQPNHTTVYIGNKKVFDGMGDYIDSENDRYGTNYVRV